MALQEKEAARAKEIGAKVRALRTEAGLSQEKVAQKAGISRETIRHIEAGDWIPGIDTLELIAGALGVPFVKLLPAALIPSSDSDTPGYLKPVGQSARRRRVKVPELVGRVAVG